MPCQLVSPRALQSDRLFGAASKLNRLGKTEADPPTAA